jgi:hypothetical protein
MWFVNKQCIVLILELKKTCLNKYETAPPDTNSLFRIQYEPLIYLKKNSDRPFKSYDFLQYRSIDVNIFFLWPGPQINLILGDGLNFVVIDILYAYARF